MSLSIASTSHEQHFAMATSGHRWPLRLTAMFVVLAAFAAMWALVLEGHALLWQRLDVPVAAERYVVDHIDVPLPSSLGREEIASACAERPWPLTTHSIAACLTDDKGLLAGSVGEAAAKSFEQRALQQQWAARAWLDAYAAQSITARAAVRVEFEREQVAGAASDSAIAAWAIWGARLLAAFGHVPSTTLREPVGRTAAHGQAADRTATALRQRLEAATVRLTSLQAATPAERLRGLALLAGGRAINVDYGHFPPEANLAGDRQSLADMLDALRLSRAVAGHGFGASDARGIPLALLNGTLLWMLAAGLAGRGRLLPVVLSGLAGLLLGAGSLLLQDVALTAEPAFRYFVLRQFGVVGAGSASWPLLRELPWPVLSGASGSLNIVRGVLPVWLPLALAASATLLLGMMKTGQGRWLSPVRGWVEGAVRYQWGGWPMAVLLSIGLALATGVSGGSGALRSELLILLAAIGLATYVAAQGPLLNRGIGLGIDRIAVVLMALAVGIGGAVARGDLGHALVAAAVGWALVWLVAGQFLRWFLLGVMAVVVIGLGWCHLMGQVQGPLAWVADAVLPPHARERVLAMFDPLHVQASDLARSRWLVASAGADGWGPGYVPWQGLAAAHIQDGLPLQGPSDYVLALAGAVWGSHGGLAALGAVLLLFVSAGAAGLHTALRHRMDLGVRMMAAVGGCGSLLMAFKVVLSLGGVSGVLPLTGLPVPLLGYGQATHFAALFYLVLVAGSFGIRSLPASAGGVDLAPRVVPAGAARRRQRVLALGLTVGTLALVGLSARQLGMPVGDGGPVHLSARRYDLAQAVSRSLRPEDGGGASGPGTPACLELEAAVGAWNRRMAHLAQPVRLASALDQPIQALRLDVHRLLETTHTSGAKACRLLAQTLGQMLDTDLGRLVGRQAAAAPVDAAGDAHRSTPRSTGVAALAAFDKPRAVGARLIDYSTANAWWGIPGCLLPVGAGIVGQPPGCGQRASAADAAADGRTDPTAMLSDAWLQHDLGPQLLTALRQPVSRRELNHRSVLSGPMLGITLDPQAQGVAQRIADCFTGHVAAADCADATPADPRWRAQHLQAPGALRAGAVGLVLVDVDSGRILALAGAVSDCTWQNLGHHAQPEASGRILAVRAGQRCAQLPDQRSAYLATQEPALWLVPPGSSLKPLAVAAGIDGGQVAAGADEHWKGILALSEAQSPVQRLALAAGQHYLDVLHGAGFGHSPQDLVWGDAASPGSAAHLKTRWPHLGHDGEKGLRPARLPFEQIERIRAEKEAGINVDQRYGHAVVTDYLAARALADAVIGGGNLRVSALGLAAWWRQVDLRARGRGEAPALHLLEQPGRPVAMASTQWLSTDAARRVLAITSGVSASAWHGTAQGSCRLVFGACPAQGLPTLSGKTGTSDFLASEGRPEVKSGLQVPAKLFAGVFTGRDGRRYAVAAMALRVREGAGQALELHPSPPAEAALVLARSLGLAQP